MRVILFSLLLSFACTHPSKKSTTTTTTPKQTSIQTPQTKITPTKIKPRIVAQLSDDLARVVLRKDMFYILEQDGLVKISKDGKDRVSLTAKIGPQRCGLFAGEETLYWTKISGFSEMPAGGFIRMVPLVDGKKEQTIKGMTFPESLVEIGDALYSLDWYNGKLTKHAAGKNQVLSNGGDGYQMLSLCSNRLVTDGEWLYYSFSAQKSTKENIGISTSLMRLSPSGGEPTVLATQVGLVSELTIDNGYLYWLSNSAKIYRVKTSGGEPELLAKTKQYSDSTIVVRGNYVYWVDGFSKMPYQIMRVSLAGGEPEVLYENQALASTALLADDTELFWVERPPDGSSRLVALSVPIQ
jgi:hypothetical protein